LLWDKENHFRLNATEGQGMHIYLSFLCTCSCDKFNAKGQICRNDKKTYTDVNPCSQKNTCTECLRNADCNWCSDPAFSYLDGSPLPRCNNDKFFTSKLCQLEKKLDPPRALSGSEDCDNCQHSCSGGICSENKQHILEENSCPSHLTCSDCIHAKDCGWCSDPENGPKCNRLSSWVSLISTEDNQVVCKADIQGWKVNTSNAEPKIINNNRNTFTPWNYNRNPYSRSEFEQRDNIVHVTAKIGVPVKLSVEWDYNDDDGINSADNPRDAVELGLTSKTYLCWECENNWPFFKDSVALDYEYICDGTKCKAGIDTFETTEKLQFDVSLTLLDCSKKKDLTTYPVYLVLYNAFNSKEKSTPYGVLKIVLDMPHCSCKCDQDCNTGFEGVHPSCGGGNKQCGKCLGCPDGTFGEFCECNTDGTERQKSNVTFEQIPTVMKGQKDDIAGNVQVKHIDKFSFGHVILEESAPAYQIQCTTNGSYCKSISYCENGEQHALYADHRLLPGSELTLKLSFCNWWGPFVGFASPPTNDSLFSRISTRSSKSAYLAQEIYAWEINEKGDAILVGEYKKGGWNKRYSRLTWQMEDFDEGAKYQYLMEKNDTTIRLKVTESEVIWSWNGFTKGDGGYRDGKYRFNQTSNDREMRHQFDIKSKPYYPIIIFHVCKNFGSESSSFEILESKAGQDDGSPVKLRANKSPQDIN